MKTLKETYDALDSLFYLSTVKQTNFIIVKGNEILYSKTYVLKYFHFDQEIRDKKLSEINSILEDEKYINNLQMTNEKLDHIDKKYEFEKFNAFGIISCFLSDKITIKIETKKYSKTFEYDDGDMLDDLLNFLKIEIKEEADDLTKGN